jgi:dTDP-4-amino-4,6-dideoxygalactose transaminase
MNNEPENWQEQQQRYREMFAHACKKVPGIRTYAFTNDDWNACASWAKTITHHRQRAEKDKRSRDDLVEEIAVRL